MEVSKLISIEECRKRIKRELNLEKNNIEIIKDVEDINGNLYYINGASYITINTFYKIKHKYIYSELTYIVPVSLTISQIKFRYGIDFTEKEIIELVKGKFRSEIYTHLNNLFISQEDNKKVKTYIHNYIMYK